MMPRVTIRGLLFSCTALLALAFAGCADAPEQDPSEGSAGEQVGQVAEEFDLAAPSTRGDADSNDTGGRRGPSDSGKKGDDKDGKSLDLFVPGSDRSEPDPVPWVPRYLMAADA